MQLRANSTKTRVSLFYLRNRECGKQLNISWNGVNLTNCNIQVYIGVTLDRTLSYKAHIEKTKNKVGTRNNIRILRNSKCGATPTTLTSSALALCYSSAEYACPLWGRSTHAKKLNARLNESSRIITSCLKSINTNIWPILVGIAPSDIRRAVANLTERTKAPTQRTSRSGVTPDIEEEFHHMHWAHQEDGESGSRKVMERTTRAPGRQCAP